MFGRKKEEPIKLAIGVPLATDWIPAQFWYSYNNLRKPIDHILITMTGALTPISREKIAMKAIKEKCTHLLWIDSDMVFREDALERLFKHNKDIVSGKFFSRYEPYEPCIWVKGIRTNIKRFCEVDSTGLAFTLIKIDVFRKLPRPWFNLKITEDRVEGEDILFFNKAREFGFRGYVDPEVYVGHLATFAIRKNDQDMLKISKN